MSELKLGKYKHYKLSYIEHYMNLKNLVKTYYGLGLNQCFLNLLKLTEIKFQDLSLLDSLSKKGWIVFSYD